ncbi:MAG: tetratricopeptide repeat protein [Planctomycetota bacterium]
MPTILTKAQRKFFRVLLWLTLFVLANSAYLFLAGRDAELTVFYQIMLAGHLIGGLALMILVTVFVLWHLPRVKRLMRPRSVISGVALTVLTYGLFATGLFIISEANARAHVWVFYSHRALALLAVAGYAAHRYVSHFQPTRVALVRAFAGFATALIVFLAVHEATQPPAEPEPVVAESPRDPFIPFVARNMAPSDSRFHPSNVTTESGEYVDPEKITRNEFPADHILQEDMETYGFLEREPVGARTCRECHPDVTAQWEDSMHRFSSFNNPWYRAAVEKSREEAGMQASQFCAGCHDPAIMLPGNFTKEIDPHGPEAQTGIACLYCHQIDAMHGREGNANFNVADNRPSPYLFDDKSEGFGRFFADLMTKAKPQAHKERFLKPMHQTSEFCMTCHKVSLDVPLNDYRWLRGQNEYDAWHDSGVAHNAARTFYLPDTIRNCQDCHMPHEPALLGDVAAKNGMVRSHRFYGPNTAMPWIRGKKEQLERIRKFREGNLLIDVFSVTHGDGSMDRGLDPAQPTLGAGDEVIFDVVVRNKGVGHTFPGGTNDSNQGWIDFRVTDQDGREIFRSGAVDDKTRRVDKRAHFYRTVMVRHDGTWATERQANTFHAPAFNRVIGPGTADVARYGFTVPEGVTSLKVEARLLWRKFNRDFHEFTFNRPGIKAPNLPHLKGKKVPDLPIDTLAQDAVTLAVGTRTNAAPGEAAWMRFNDHGIASFLQGALDIAEESWRRVADLEPEMPHGWRNLARRWIVSGQPQKARSFLEKVDEVAPKDPQRPYFWGRYYERMEEFEQAERAYLASLEVFPQDRDAWRRLGAVRYKLQRWEDSLDAYLEVLKIDPEDRESHKRRLDIYRQLGDEKKAAEAQKAFEKYRLDDEREQVIRKFLQEHPEINEDAQPRHIHR